MSLLLPDMPHFVWTVFTFHDKKYCKSPFSYMLLILPFSLPSLYIRESKRTEADHERTFRGPVICVCHSPLWFIQPDRSPESFLPKWFKKVFVVCEPFYGLRLVLGYFIAQTAPVGYRRVKKTYRLIACVKLCHGRIGYACVRICFCRRRQMPCRPVPNLKTGSVSEQMP